MVMGLSPDDSSQTLAGWLCSVGFCTSLRLRDWISVSQNGARSSAVFGKSKTRSCTVSVATAAAVEGNSMVYVPEEGAFSPGLHALTSARGSAKAAHGKRGVFDISSLTSARPAALRG